MYFSFISQITYLLYYFCIKTNSHVYYFELPNACNPTRLHSSPLVVEPSPIRSLAADCPLKKSRGFNLALIQIIFSVFTTVTLEYISSLRCGLFAFRVFQQLNRFYVGINLPTSFARALSSLGKAQS